MLYREGLTNDGDTNTYDSHLFSNRSLQVFHSRNAFLCKLCVHKFIGSHFRNKDSIFFGVMIVEGVSGRNDVTNIFKW